MRRAICIMAVLFGFVFLLTQQVIADDVQPPVKSSAGKSLTDVLMEKGVISKDEAKEIKKDEEKGLNLPKGLQGVSLGGTYFINYFIRNYDSGSKANDNGFSLDRAYLTLGKEFTPWFSTRATVDVTYDKKRGSTGTDASEIGWEVRIKYAYGLFDFKNLFGMEMLGDQFRLQSEVGLVHNASDNYDDSLWPYRVEGKNFLDRHNIMSTSDYGANMHLTLGEMDKEFKERVESKYASRWGGVYFGVYNGAGFDRNERNDTKFFEGQLWIRPLNMFDWGKGIRLAAQYGNGESDAKFAVPAGSTAYPQWNIQLYTASYQHELFTIFGQYYAGKGTKTSTEEKNRTGWDVAGFVKMPFWPCLRLFAKYDDYTPDDDARTSAEEKTQIYGISYDLAKGLMVYTAMERTNYDLKSAGPDTSLYQMGLKAEF
ncbi:MAG: hypothetical protein HQK57_05615 [Deltaproteobacteria bacterium]|nr:hypothetical protein [Deltaproteobacteria bacterium]MBF0508389.1 hypothetical protein [Deltaproteobacteria bacterium]MBF0526780.1 hypothetical protein [Deltaproteobacteria bacterium]